MLGALIGVARAIDGNEHLINDQVNDMMLTGICHLFDSDNNTINIDILIDGIHNIKKLLAPMCFECGSPCGRTEDFDCKELIKVSDVIKKEVLSILKAINSIIFDDKHYDNLIIIYNALFYIGMPNVSLEHLNKILIELNQIIN